MMRALDHRGLIKSASALASDRCTRIRCALLLIASCVVHLVGISHQQTRTKSLEESLEMTVKIPKSSTLDGFHSPNNSTSSWRADFTATPNLRGVETRNSASPVGGNPKTISLLKQLIQSKADDEGAISIANNPNNVPNEGTTQSLSDLNEFGNKSAESLKSEIHPKDSVSSPNGDNFTISSDDGLLDHFNYCHGDYLGDENNEQAGFPIWYQCVGPRYDEFTEELHRFVEHNVSGALKNPEWGHRESAVPANTSVLFFGNSHTRQLGLNVACQMGADQVVDVYHFEFDLIDPNMAVRFRYRNGASIYIVTNSYAAYSQQWQSLLERQIAKPLAEFDLVVLGIFNVAKGESAFLHNLKHLASTLPKEYQLNLETDPRGPSPRNITDVYDGPFMLVSNASVNQGSVYRHHRKIVKKSKRSDHTALDQRRYVEMMNEEGASTSKFGEKDMILEVTGSNRTASRMHRCTGKRGGFPDLVSWDVTEFLYQHAVRH